jgi:hypothetical protein
MSRLSLSDVLEIQARQIDRYEAILQQVLEALTERRQSTESVTVKRTSTGQNPTAVEVNTVTRNGETLHDAAERARVEYELLSARFPLPSGAAHAAPLGDWPGAE